MYTITRRNLLKAIGAVSLTPATIIGGTLASVLGNKASSVDDIASNHFEPKASGGTRWYVTPIDDRSMYEPDTMSELSYRGFGQMTEIPGANFVGFPMNVSSLKDAFQKTGHLTGIFPAVRVVEIKDGKTFYQDLSTADRTDFSSDRRGLLGVPKGIEEIIRQENEFYRNNPYRYNRNPADWRMTLALAAAESDFDPNARGIEIVPVANGDSCRFRQLFDKRGNPNYSGAKGIFQVKDEAAIDVGINPKKRDIKHPRINSRVGVAYINKQLKDFGNVDMGIYTYNRGPNDTMNDLESGYRDLQALNHVRKVKALYLRALAEERAAGIMYSA